MTIQGTIMDTSLDIPVQSAMAMVIRTRDSVLVDFKRTDPQGQFKFELPIDTFQLIIRHPSYKDFNSYFFGSPENKDFDLTPLIMPDKSTSIGEFVVYANRNPIYYNGDTLVYVADSFKVKDGAVVEDLLKRLPGIKVDADGKITSQGTQIDQVLVDGDEFFGGDQTVATKNLAAKGVDKVKLYEKDSEDGSDEKIQVLDLTLKDEAKKGYFGKISGATDFNRFYESELLLNKYSSRQKIAVFGLGSNTPKANIGRGDLFKFGLSDGPDWMNESDDLPSNNAGGSSVNTSNGVPQTFRGGFFLDQKLWTGGKVRLDYTYSDNKITRETSSRSQYFLTDTSYTTDQSSLAKEDYLQHSINVKFTQQLDSLSRIEIEPKLTLNYTNTNSSSSTAYIAQDSTTTRATEVDNEQKATGATLNTTVRYYKDFKKKNRKLIVRYNITMVNNAADGSLLSTDRNALTLNVNQAYDQKKVNRNTQTANTAYADYTEPLFKSKRLKAEFEYEFYQNSNDQRKSTYDKQNGSYDVLNTLFSNQFATDRMQNRAGAFFIFDNLKTRVSVGTRVRNIGIDNRNILKDTLIRQDLTNVLPRVVIQHKFSQSNRLRFQYNTGSTLPSVDQLQPVQDNTNPNSVRLGNANLKPNYTHTFNLNYNMWKGLSGFYVYSGMTYVLQQNAFSSSTTYDAFNRTYSQAINVNYADNGTFYGGTGFAIPKMKDFRAELNGNANFNRSQNYIQLQKNLSNNVAYGSDFELSFNGDSLSTTLGAGFTHTIPSNTLSSASSKPYSTYNFSGSFDWTMPGHIRFKTDFTYTLNTKRTQGYNLNYFIWNASIQYAFLKTENLLLGFEANDILNQNISAYRQVTTNVITDNKTNIIARYLLVRVTYKFNSNKTHEDDARGPRY